MSTDVWKVYDEKIIKEARIEAENEGFKKGFEEGFKIGFEETFEEAFEEGREEIKIEFAKGLLSENIPIDKIMRITRLTRDDINNLR